MRNNMGDVNNIDNKESDNVFEGSDVTIITNTDVDIIDLDKSKTEKMALKIFITDQLYLLKQSIGNPKICESNCDSKSKSDSHIKSLIEQIHYLKEENKIKISFIQSLLSQNSSTTAPNDSFCYNDKVNETSPPSNDDHVFDDIEGTKDENINDEDNNIDEKNVTIKKSKNKKKKRKTQSTKDQNEEINNNTKHNDNKNINSNSIYHNSTASPPKSKETVLILDLSMVKKINGFFLTKNIKHKYLVKVRPFSSAKTSCMHDHAKPTIRAINPEHIILYVGTNDFKSEKTVSQIANSITELANSLKNEINSIHVSLTVPRNHNLSNKVN